MSQILIVHDWPLAVCRFAPQDAVPPWALRRQFFAVTRTPQELSIVCDAAQVPPDVKQQSGFICLEVQGPIDFSVVGVLAGISAVMAQAAISIFAISTYDTDYILLNKAELAKAAQALEKAGYRITYPTMAA